jgi:preprotein translocase subunit Sec63
MMRGRGQTHYEVLGVNQAASAAEIRAAYLALVERYHPDRHDGNALADLATEKLASINAAYEILSDPKRRAMYDSELARGAPRADAARAAQQPRHAVLLRAMVVILGLLVLLRLLPILIKALANLVRMLWEGAGLLRGTPLLALVFLLVVGGSVVLVVRRRRGRRHK